MGKATREFEKTVRIMIFIGGKFFSPAPHRRPFLPNDVRRSPFLCIYDFSSSFLIFIQQQSSLSDECDVSCLMCEEWGMGQNVPQSQVALAMV
jgi:hypothetical protein